jgi:hypothetical protein
MTQQNILELAKQGNLTAITQTLNYLFQDQHITTKVTQQNDCLRIILTADNIPEQQLSVNMIHQTMIKLQSKNIEKVIIYGQQINQSTIAWEQSLDVSYIVAKNIPKTSLETPQKSSGFQWTPWFPYPGSWLRTLLLAGISFPTISLIIWVFPAIIVASVTKNILLLSIFTLTGIILPSLFLAGIYQLAFFQWKEQEWFKDICLWWEKSHSLWEGFYGIFVFGVSWLIIFCIIWGLAVFHCQSYYNNHLTEYINECSARSIKETMNAIVYFIQHPWDYNYRYRYFYYGYSYNYELSASMLFGLWVIFSAYLYQVEYVIRKKVTLNQIKQVIFLVILAFGLTQIIHFINMKSAEYKESLTIVSSPKITPNPTNTLTPPVTETPTPPVTETAKPPVTETAKLPVTETPKIEYDPFREAVNKATKAAEMTQTAKTSEQWNLVASEWQQAISLMKDVPLSNSHYEVAQKKISEYEKYLDHAISQGLNKK